MSNYDFTGRSAIVTGAAKGIGYAIAHKLSEQGCKVALWDRDAAGLKSAMDSFGEERSGLHATAVDVISEEEICRAYDSAIETIGPVDLLVNNAGIIGPTVSTIDYPLSDWQQVLDIDLTGVFLCSKTVAPGMVGRGYGRIVNITSIAGKEGTANAPAYSAAKAGVIAFTKAMGKELTGTGVLVNSIAPGPIKTEMVASMDPRHLETMLSKCPMNRFGTVEECAEMACWLLSDFCSFNTGACFDLSGGRATY